MIFFASLNQDGADSSFLRPHLQPGDPDHRRYGHSLSAIRQENAQRVSETETGQSQAVSLILPKASSVVSQRGWFPARGHKQPARLGSLSGPEVPRPTAGSFPLDMAGPGDLLPADGRTVRACGATAAGLIILCWPAAREEVHRGLTS